MSNDETEEDIHINLRQQLAGSAVILVDKPNGITSHTCVQIVRRFCASDKAGHGGTLDPMASGLLPVCIGKATRLTGYALHADKRYIAIVQLGISSDTQDFLGKTLFHQKVPLLSTQIIGDAVEKLKQSPTQKIPDYSAKKIKGTARYDLARQHIAIPESFHEAKLLDYKILFYDQDLSQIHLELHVSKGFYVRQFAVDLGALLGTCALLNYLRRTAIGPWTLARSVPLQKLAPPFAYKKWDIGMASFSQLPKITLSNQQIIAFCRGQIVHFLQQFEVSCFESFVVVCAASDESLCLGIGVIQGTQSMKPHAVFVQMS